MIGLWMLYAVLIGALLSGAAAAGAWALRAYGRPSRAVWMSAIAASVLVPAAALLLPETFAAGWLSGPDGGGGALVLEAVARGGSPVASPARPWWAAAVDLAGRLDPFLVALWVVSALSLVGFLALSWIRLRRERAAWESREVAGVPVLLSRERGPAVLGLRRARIVLPRWTLELEEDLRALVLLHEQEHVRAGDHRSFAAGLLAAALVPWNPALWWQLRRLRLAIECDCDRRVLDRGVSPARYGELLLRAGGRAPGVPFVAAALAEPRSFLERRVHAMTRGRVRNRMMKAVLAAAAAAGLLAVACETPTPPREDGEAGAEAPASASGPASRDPEARPTFIPYDVPPKLQNMDDVRRALRDEYPPELREAGIGGTVTLWLYLDEDGVVRKTLVQAGADEEALDDAARAVVEEMRFSPALNRDAPTAVWVQQKITFEPDEDGVTRPDAAPAATREADVSPGAEGGRFRLDQALVEGTLERPAEDGEAGGRYRIRLNAGRSAEPLVVVDGVIRTDPDLRALRTLDIEKIDVVRGKEALALYGERARNGLVQITTKSEGKGSGSSR